MTTTSIEWTRGDDGTAGATWNPTKGCTIVSPGCTHCYAMRMAARLEAMGQQKYTGLTVKKNGHSVWTGKMTLDEDSLSAPLGWKKPRRVFVNSMSDLFHEGVPFEFIDRVFAVMALCPRHTFQILTKRPERMAEYTQSRAKSSKYWEGAVPEGRTLRWEHDGVSHPLARFPLPNVWLGTSVEDQQRADERIPHLLRCPAAVRFLSAEPLLGAVEFSNVSGRADGVKMLGKRALSGISWCIVGGESGPGARPMHPNWARSLRDQCQAAGVAFFFKQFGEWTHIVPGTPWRDVDLWMNKDGRTEKSSLAPAAQVGVWNGLYRVGKKAAGRMLDGREWSEFPSLSPSGQR